MKLASERGEKGTFLACVLEGKAENMLVGVLANTINELKLIAKELTEKFSF